MFSEYISFLAGFSWWIYLLLVFIVIVIKDAFFNKKHTIKHNFPLLGRMRYLLESIGPEIRQYFIANDREELPFNRIERGWIYASSKKENNYESFGTAQDLHKHKHFFIKNSLIPYASKSSTPLDFLPCAKVMGVYHNRKKPFRPRSVINVSAMSYGSLSSRAISSLNIGIQKSGGYHNTGEGGLSPYHSHGGDVVFHFGTGYFGVRDDKGNFSFDKIKKLVQDNPFIRAIEVKLSQGAKPGKGGVLPAAKITPIIAQVRGVEMGNDVLSPASHNAFSTLEELIDFIEKIADITGLPVGIKAAIGKTEDWERLADLMKSTKKGPDFIAIDGSEGGTGAAPPSFADHVALPWAYAFSKIYKIFQQRDLAQHIVFIGSGKLGFPAKAAYAFAMGVDIINVAREAMISIGCIQAQVCHTNKCPTGIATQNKWLEKGIDVPLKSDRLAQYFKTFRKELLAITHAAGYAHPASFTMQDIELNVDDIQFTQTLESAYNYIKTPVVIPDLDELFNCSYLGALPKEVKS